VPRGLPWWGRDSERMDAARRLHQRHPHERIAAEADGAVRVKLRKWRRYHRDGSEGLVEEREVGAFVAVDLIPVAYGIRRGILRECLNLEEAFLEVDCAAERRGHTCTPTCTRWRLE
jgi:hypothetical protein